MLNFLEIFTQFFNNISFYYSFLLCTVAYYPELFHFSYITCFCPNHFHYHFPTKFVCNWFNWYNLWYVATLKIRSLRSFETFPLYGDINEIEFSVPHWNWFPPEYILVPDVLKLLGIPRDIYVRHGRVYVELGKGFMERWFI